MLLKSFLVATGIKCMLFPAYKSTDYEVHRNWFAITHSLSWREWYVENTSEWTLDYPPLFAWFQYFLSHFAHFFDAKMLIVTNINYNSFYATVFMRSTVLFADLALLLGCKEIRDYFVKNPFRKCSRWKLMWGSPTTVFYILVMNNIGLFIVDHIHFQYNGILFGILLISIGKVLKREYIWGAFWFAVLLNMKHIFLYMAPAFGIYLLKNYCLEGGSKKFNRTVFLERVMQLGIVVILVTAVSFGPFILIGQGSQVFSRLFPFKRGLCHTYWAPNVWAIYNIMDKVLLKVFAASTFLNKGFSINGSVINATGSMTSGVLQSYEHIFLPTITPSITAALYLLSIMPCVWKLWTSPGNPLHFVRSIVICTCCAFLFGWHVHEKAILMAIIPLSLMAVLLLKEAEVYTLLSIVGHYSLLPLIFTAHEILIKGLLLGIYSFYTISALTDLFQANGEGIIPILDIKENVYLGGLFGIFIYEHIFHKLYGIDKIFPFMPLLLTSCYCALGIIYCTIKYYYNFLIMQGSEHKQKTF